MMVDTRKLNREKRKDRKEIMILHYDVEPAGWLLISFFPERVTSALKNIRV